MSDAVIQVENLGKKYIIGHQQQERYTALRDVIANGAKSLGQRLLKPWGKQSANPAYEEFWALKDVSFEVKQGDRIGIIGRNGAGKSTLLKILSRITEPTTGKIRIKGRVASLLEVGTGFHPELTGRENIFLNSAILGMSKAETRHKFDEIVAFAEVEKFLDTPVKRYSSGMYVRLAFAVAAHLEPDILVVDEVLAVGDAQFQKKCLGKMEDVGQEGRTVLFVSHNMNAVEALCTSAMHLKSGQLFGIGAVSDQIELYLNSFQEQSEITYYNPTQLGENLQLQRLAISPNPVVSGEPVEFALEFWSSEATQLNEVALLIHSAMGIRVALLNLKTNNLTHKLDGATTYTIVVTAKSIPLVAGDYNVGLFLSCGKLMNNFLDLSVLTVVDKEELEHSFLYPNRLRGFIEIDFQIYSSYL
ncbi:MAG: polysaccharide ABC transporter ATP-binding protein [Coleofasciculus sp. D1-CHI-01]|uniref:ABC transporter ATP-binding protein n=1 Tax=Coleofasciculus sp. D1-CHI-01 TaxID=3068482 RepID=UPI0032F8D4C4